MERGGSLRATVMGAWSKASAVESMKGSLEADRSHPRRLLETSAWSMTDDCASLALMDLGLHVLVVSLGCRWWWALVRDIEVRNPLRAAVDLACCICFRPAWERSKSRSMEQFQSPIDTDDGWLVTWELRVRKKRSDLARFALSPGDGGQYTLLK